MGLSILRARDGRPLRHPGAVFGWLFPLLLDLQPVLLTLMTGCTLLSIRQRLSISRVGICLDLDSYI